MEFIVNRVLLFLDFTKQAMMPQAQTTIFRHYIERQKQHSTIPTGYDYYMLNFLPFS